MSKSMKETERRMIATVLFAARASVDAALMALGENIDGEEKEEKAVCTHPIERREDLTEMGGPLEWRCRACGFHSTTEEPPPLTEG